MINTDILHLREMTESTRELAYEQINKEKDKEVQHQLALAIAHLRVAEALFHQACGTMA